MEITIKTSKKEQVIDITEQINKIVEESGVKEGICNVFVLHATASIIINENWDPNIGTDLLNFLNKIIPQGIHLHDKVDGNGAAHLKSALLGPSETVPVKNGKLLLGRWQSVMLVELDGARERKINVEII